MTKIIEWRQKMLSELPSDEDLFVEKFLMDGIQDLCRQTQCLNEVITDTSVATQPTYTLVPVTANSKFIRFLYGKYNNKHLENRTVGEMAHWNWKWELSTGDPAYIVYEGGNTIRWSSIPDTTGDPIEFTVSIMPTDIVDSDIPEKIEDEHIETVKDYVKWKYFLQATTFNEKLAAYHEKRYIRGKGNLRISVLTGFSGNSQAKQVSFLSQARPAGF
jgi:hypothetical protein